MNLKGNISGDKSDSQKKNKNKPSDSRTKGKVIVSYSNYMVNKGISDSIFENKDNK